MADRTCLVAGGSGLVGGHLLKLLADDPTTTEIRVLTRRPLGLQGPKLRERVVSFDDPASLAEHAAVDDVYCCLGTTIKIAGSQEAFRKVDHDAPVAIAKASRQAGAGHYLIVTAVGADAGSSLFYNRVKGETENELRALDFPRGLSIFHPSLLLGERAEPRPGEGLATAVMKVTRPLFVAGLTRYRAIDAAVVARAMLAASKRTDGGTRVYEGKALFALGAMGQPS